MVGAGLPFFGALAAPLELTQARPARAGVEAHTASLTATDDAIPMHVAASHKMRRIPIEK
jgi:hypothetical protein